MNSSEWAVGETVENLYEVRGINREGGMSVVYFVWHHEWQMDLVIKSPRPELFTDPAVRTRFMQEAETWVKLGLHPNIVNAYYVRLIGELPRIMIEKMDGGSLKTWLNGGLVRDLGTALDIAIQIATGLAYAQSSQP